VIVSDPPPTIANNVPMQKLAASMNSYKLEFSVFVGDTKSGSSKCDDTKLQITKDLFKLQQVSIQLHMSAASSNLSLYSLKPDGLL
jgi:hypothetical protein